MPCVQILHDPVPKLHQTIQPRRDNRTNYFQIHPLIVMDNRITKADHFLQSRAQVRVDDPGCRQQVETLAAGRGDAQLPGLDDVVGQGDGLLAGQQDVEHGRVLPGVVSLEGIRGVVFFTRPPNAALDTLNLVKGDIIHTAYARPVRRNSARISARSSFSFW